MIKNKRLKSFFINLASYVGSALLALIASPLFPQITAWLSEQVNGRLAAWGVPAVLIAAFGFVIAEVWKNILNNRIIAKAYGSKVDYATAQSARPMLDLY